MARFTSALTTLQTRTIISMINSTHATLSTKEAIEKVANHVVENAEKTFPAQFPANLHNAYMAFTLSACGKIGVKNGDLNVVEYISMLASAKRENEQNLRDFGAFGDLFEILIRCSLIRNIHLVKWSSLSVKDVKHADIVSKRFGVVEVGHNGKSFTFGTLVDFMEGDYTSIIYGVFNEQDKEAVYNLCIEGSYEKAIDYVTNYAVYWANKYDFQRDMDNLTRGKGIAVKGENIQVVFNPGKYDAFVNAIENGAFKSLNETLSE